MTDPVTVAAGRARPARWARRAVALMCVVFIMSATFIASVGTSEAAAKYGTVRAATQKMVGPHLSNYRQVGTYAVGRKLTLTCYIWGQMVTGWGGKSNLWYRVSDGYYAADVDLYTGSNNPITGACPTIGLRDFIAQSKGKVWANAAGTYPGECVSLVSQYLLRVKGIKTGAWGNAVDYRSGASGGNQLKARGFKWSTNRSFKDGDILVFNRTAPYGHIGIWHGGKLYDQNNSGRRAAGYSSFFPSGYLGYWRK